MISNILIATHHNVWKEVADGEWDVITMGPEMLQSKAVGLLLDWEGFKKKVGLVYVDEAHLVYEWGAEFHKDFWKIGELCSQLPSSVTWLAMSATLQDLACVKVQHTLGFKENQFHDVKLPIDRTDLKYCPRFLSHSIEGLTFPDLAWVIPIIVNTPSDLP